MSESTASIPIKHLACTRCWRDLADVPIGSGNAFQDQSLATVYIQQDEQVLYVVPHAPGCSMLKDGLGEVRRIV